MLRSLARYWWVLALRGILAVLFGVVAFAWPGLTLETLVLFFGAWALVNGVFTIAAALAGRGAHDHWLLLLLEGAVGVAVGILTYRAPGLTTVVLVMYVAAWALMTGAFQVATAIRLRKEIEGEVWLALAGVASIAFALILLARPLAGALALLWVIAAYAIVLGLFLVMLGFRLRGLHARASAGGSGSS